MSTLSRASACRAEASGEGGASLVVMLMAGGGGHGLLDFLVETERETFHFGEVTAALFWRHDLADGHEVLEHLRLALAAKFAELNQFLLGGGSDVGPISQRGFDFGSFGGDARTHLGALRFIAFMKLPDARHVGIT